MVDIHSMVASSHPSHHEWGAEGEATSCSRVGQSRRAGNRTVATAAMVTPQCQYTASTVATPPSVAATEVTLVGARQLLNNPPLPHTSPYAVEQWRHDIDQLIITAINMPFHRRQ
jgi:hypothetical protein